MKSIFLNEVKDVIHNDGEWSLARVQSQGASEEPSLVLFKASGQVSESELAALQKEYKLRELLPRDYAVIPVRLEEEEGATRLYFKDPGGGSLEQRMPTTSDIQSILEIASAICSTLREIHAKGIVHRDIKPGNFLFDAQNKKLFIRGFASSLLPSESTQSQQELEGIVGTYAYMSPEQTGRMNLIVDARSDLYSLGICLYQMTTGTLPFEAQDLMEWVHCHVARSVSDPKERQSSLPPILSEIILKLLKKSPDERYQSAFGLQHDLERCLGLWQKNGKIDAFPLGSHDSSGTLKLPRTLFGRDIELEKLQRNLEKLKKHESPTPTLVSGTGGMGKSALLESFHGGIAQPLLYAAGSFDQFRRESPNTLVSLAFKDLIQNLLFMNDNDLSSWREKIKKALKENGQLMVDLVPNLEIIIGKQSAVTPLPAAEAKKRFNNTFLDLLRVFANESNPLVLFLDDLHWIDDASVQLLELITLQPTIKELYFIGAYRESEWAAQPLLKAFETKAKESSKVEFLSLTAISQEAMTALVAESLSVEPKAIADLSQAIFQKTEGNPFFTLQFLQSLNEEKILQFSMEKRIWTWDLKAIEAKGFSDNVAEIMLEKLSRLSDDMKTFLAKLACFGFSTPKTLLPRVVGKDGEELQSLLNEGLRLGLLVASDDQTKFSHDRISKAAYALLSEDSRALEHLRIGRLLLESSSKEAIEAELFSIVAQFNRGRSLIDSPTEKALIRDLNYRAGSKAKLSTAYKSARDLFAIATETVTPSDWMENYASIFALYLERVECEFLAGDFACASTLSIQTLENAKTKLDQLKVYSLSMRLYQMNGNYEEAIRSGIDCMKLFDLQFPQGEDELNTLYLSERKDIAPKIAGRSIAELVNTPPPADMESRAIINMLSDLAVSVAVVRPKSRLYALLVARIVNMSLEKGCVEKSCFIFANYARMLIVESSDIASSVEFAEMALKLGEKFNLPAVTGPLVFFYGVYLQHWTKPIDGSIATIERALKACFDSGNFVFTSFSAYFLPSHIFAKTEQLQNVIDACDKYSDFAKQIHNEVLNSALLLYKSVVRTLTDPAANDSNAAEEAQLFAFVQKAHFAPALACHFVLKQNISFIFERYAEAHEFGMSASQVLAPGGLAFTSFFFYQSLSAIALCRQAGPEKLADTLKGIAVPLQKLKLMAESCPENFQNRYALVLAEIAALEGRVLDAEGLYEEAIQSARINGFVQIEAIASELAGKFYLGRSSETIAYAYLKEAHRAYERWGALGKVRQMENRYPELLVRIQKDRGTQAESATQNLDVMTITKASQAISEEIVLDQVIEKLMTIALENAGAVRGLLILPKDNSFHIVAEAKTGKVIEVTMRESNVSSEDLPESIFQFLLRTKEQIMIENAETSASFGADPYIQRTHAKSLILLPLMKQGAMVGVLYLENNLVPAAFTKDRMAVLETISSQAAISVENARLYREVEEHREHLEELVAERTEKLNQKTKDIEAMLQNMDLGICTIIPGMKIHHEFSQHLCTIFETPDFAGRDFLETMFINSSLGSDLKDRVAIALDSIIGEDEMMFELNAHLLPAEMMVRMPQGEKIVQMNWIPISDSAEMVEKVLFISQDVTKLRELELAAAAQREEMDIISKLLNTNPSRFNDYIKSSLGFLSENREILLAHDQFQEEAIAALFRNMHTIKGNARTYGFAPITNASHEAEHFYDQLRKGIVKDWDKGRMMRELLAVEAALNRVKDINDVKLGRAKQIGNLNPGELSISKDQLQVMKELVNSLGKTQSSPAFKTLSNLVASIGMIALKDIVIETIDNITPLLADLEKPSPIWDLSGPEIYLDAGFAEVLGSCLMHLVSNSMSHGIERPADRLSAQKKERGTIHFGCELRDEVLELRIADDGRGLPLHKLYEKGKVAGLVSADRPPSAQAVADLVFYSGLSTAENLSQISGRGVGMDAVRNFLTKYDVKINIRLDAVSESMGFTPFHFVLRIPSQLFRMNTESKSLLLGAS